MISRRDMRCGLRFACVLRARLRNRRPASQFAAAAPAPEFRVADRTYNAGKSKVPTLWQNRCGFNSSWKAGSQWNLSVRRPEALSAICLPMPMWHDIYTHLVG